MTSSLADAFAQAKGGDVLKLELAHKRNTEAYLEASQHGTADDIARAIEAVANTADALRLARELQLGNAKEPA